MANQRSDMLTDYAAAGFGGALTPGQHPALILVDFARAYFDPASPLSANYNDVRHAAIRVRNAAATAGVPIAFTRVEYDGTDPARDGGQFYRKVPSLACFDVGNPLGNFTDDLRPDATDIVITKQYPSAFFGTDLAERLHTLRIDTCLIAGLSTSGCVRATTLDALCHGFVPIVITDACGDRNPAIHDANLFDLAAKYAEIMESAEAVAYFGRVGA